jgi:hypothetical protein
VTVQARGGVDDPGAAEKEAGAHHLPDARSHDASDPL